VPTVLLKFLNLLCFYLHQLIFYFTKIYETFGFEAIFPTEVNAHIFLTQSLIVLIMALLIGLYPLWFVNGLNPVKAMKK